MICYSKRISLIALTGLGLTACWVPLETGNVMQQDIGNLQRVAQESRKSIDQQRAELKEQMQRAEAKIGEVSVALQTLNRAARNTDADFGIQIERLIKEIQELRGALELSGYRLTRMEQHFSEESSIITRIETLEQSLQQGQTIESPASPEQPTSRQKLMLQAKNLTKAGKIEEARGVYRAIVRKWPNKLGTTDEAYFRLGELYYQKGKYRSALQEYVKVHDKFPKGVYADDAYFRIGVCFMQIGELEDAQAFFQIILENHPKSPLVKNSKAKLETIRQRLKAEKKKRQQTKKKKR